MIPSGLEPESTAWEADVLSNYTMGPNKEYYRILSQEGKGGNILFTYLPALFRRCLSRIPLFFRFFLWRLRWGLLKLARVLWTCL